MKQRNVYTASDGVNAEIVKDMLESHGIRAHVAHQHFWAGAAGALPANLAPRVWVADTDDLERALELVAAFKKGPVDKGQAWVCDGCGEFLPGQFDRCWRCETPR